MHLHLDIIHLELSGFERTSVVFTQSSTLISNTKHVFASSPGCSVYKQRLPVRAGL